MHWPIWRCILSEITTLREVEEHWSILDMQDANFALDLKQEQERRQYEKINPKKG